MFTLNEKYNEGIKIDPYNETRTLALAQQGNDGKEYIQWCTREMGKDKKIIKAIVGLRFVDIQQLQDFAKWLVGEVLPGMKLTAKESGEGEDIPFPDDIPF